MAFNFLSAPMRSLGFGAGAKPMGVNRPTQPQVGPTRLGGNRFGNVARNIGQQFGQRQPPANDLPSQGGYGGNYPQQSGIGPSQSPWQRFAGQFGGQMPMTGNMYNMPQMPQRPQPQDSTGLGNMSYLGGSPTFNENVGIGPSFDLAQLTGGNSGIAGGLFNRGFGGSRMM